MMEFLLPPIRILCVGVPGLGKDQALQLSSHATLSVEFLSPKVRDGDGLSSDAD